MQPGKVGGERCEPSATDFTGGGVDQQRRADLDDDTAEFLQAGAGHGSGQIAKAALLSGEDRGDGLWSIVRAQPPSQRYAPNARSGRGACFETSAHHERVEL